MSFDVQLIGDALGGVVSQSILAGNNAKAGSVDTTEAEKRMRALLELIVAEHVSAVEELLADLAP